MLSALYKPLPSSFKLHENCVALGYFFPCLAAWLVASSPMLHGGVHVAYKFNQQLGLT